MVAEPVNRPLRNQQPWCVSKAYFYGVFGHLRNVGCLLLQESCRTRLLWDWQEGPRKESDSKQCKSRKTSLVWPSPIPQ